MTVWLRRDKVARQVRTNCQSERSRHKTALSPAPVSIRECYSWFLWYISDGTVYIWHQAYERWWLVVSWLLFSFSVACSPLCRVYFFSYPSLAYTHSAEHVSPNLNKCETSWLCFLPNSLFRITVWKEYLEREQHLRTLIIVLSSQYNYSHDTLK